MSTLKELEVQRVSQYLLEVLRRQGFASLTDFQLNAVNTGIIRGQNEILVSHDYDEAYQIAEVALLNRVASDFNARAIVICPTPHIAEKRMKSVAQKCSKMGIESAAVIRRRSATTPEMKRGRVIVTTFQAMGIALRSHPEILEDVASVLVERLDLIGQPKVGAKLETVLVTLMSLERPPQFIATTPPVADVRELSEWLAATVVTDSKPEVNRIFSVKSFESVEESLADITEFVHYGRGQIMILCANMSSSEKLAMRLAFGDDAAHSGALDLRLSPEAGDSLKQLAAQVRTRFPVCKLSDRLARVLSKGVPFVHEGVPKFQRRLISSAWESGLVPVILMPSEFAVASGLRATVVFLLGVFMQSVPNELSQGDELTMLSEWQLADVLQAVGRPGLDNEAFGIVVVDKEPERKRVLDKFFETDKGGNISPRLGEVDSSLDDPENVQDLILSRICGRRDEEQDPFWILNRTYWASRNRVTGIGPTEVDASDDADAETMLSRRTTHSTLQRASEVPDSSVRLVSVTPMKIEGLVHSGTRELWHYVSFRSAEGASCSCESWKYQGIRRHRLCKHLAKVALFALGNVETRPYAMSVIRQSLRGLTALGTLETDGLVVREGGKIRCTTLGQNVAMLGVPAHDAHTVMSSTSGKEGSLKDILLQVVTVNTGFPKALVKRILDSVPAGSTEKIVCGDDLPGVVENILEEIQYVNTILLKIMSGEARKGMNSESLRMQRELTQILDGGSQGPQ